MDKILIGADFVATKSNEHLFEKGDVTQLLGGDLEDIVKECAIRIFNLESPFSEGNTPIKKSGPNISSNSNTIELYTKMNVDILTLANNHIFDYGQEGLNNTCKIIEEAGIRHVGVGQNLLEAAKPLVVSFKEKKVGIYACVEHEFSVATRNSPGANPFDPLESFEHVELLAEECDYVIVLYHGGKEHYRYPTPNLQRIARKFVNSGANLILCQHSHCIGCEEKYKGSTIVYGQGNFLFDYSDSDYWKDGLLVTIDELFNIEYIPIVKQNNTVRLASIEQAERIMFDFAKRSKDIETQDFVYSEFEKFALNSFYYNILMVKGIKNNLLFKIIYKLFGESGLSWIVKHCCKDRYLRLIKNTIDCETHSELLTKGIDMYLKEN